MTRHRSPSRGRPSEANHSRALVRVDGTTLRRTLKKEYEKALRDLERLREQIDHFNAEDVPKFTRWFHATFGGLLTELRGIARRLQEHQQILFEIEEEIFFTGASEARAYARVMDRRQNPPANSPEDSDGSSQSRGPKREQKGRKHVEEDFDGPDEKEWNELDDLLSDALGIPSGTRQRQSTAPRAENRAGRLKELYRALARLLHPDTQKQMTPQKREWWHQVQEAYSKGDVEQLEVILTLCEIDEKGTMEHTSASLLQRVTRQLKSSCRSLRAKLRQCQNEPAWGFAKRTSLYPLEVQMRRELDSDLRRLREDLKQIESLIATYSKRAARLRKGAPRKRRQRSQAEFPN